MAQLTVSRRAVEDLARLIVTHSLPSDTPARVTRSLRPLAEFPLMGSPVEGTPYRFLLGPWRWMLIVYVHDEDVDRVTVIGIEDARSASAVSAMRRP
ncbi:MAG: type II toxin-antitoxin system RelE/ParE family toxin [Actinomycetota bacterium]|nr:type II toxin-antitoxin system RelE/ParE family toxin [Actinomycetota bacterium]